LTITTLMGTDPDRGLNLVQPALYYEKLLQSYLWIGDWSKARGIARDWQRREPGLRGVPLETDAYIAAIEGDEKEVAEQLQALASISARSQQRYERTVANTTTLLRTRGGKPEAADRIVSTLLGDRLSEPVSAGSASMARIDLLMSMQRWPEALTTLDLWSVKLDSLQRTGEWPRVSFIRRTQRDARRAVVLLHLQRTAEARVIDSALAVSENARWDQGHSALARAAIAAHRGENDRAIELLQKAIRSGATGFLDFRAYPSVEADPLFLPLTNDPRFKALARPDPIDG
jgi:hypothetical protein